MEKTRSRSGTSCGPRPGFHAKFRLGHAIFSGWVGSFSVIRVFRYIIRKHILQRTLEHCLGQQLFKKNYRERERDRVMMLLCLACFICLRLVARICPGQGHTRHILLPSEIDLRLFWADFTGSEGKHLFHRIG